VVDSCALAQVWAAHKLLAMHYQTSLPFLRKVPPPRPAAIAPGPPAALMRAARARAQGRWHGECRRAIAEVPFHMAQALPARSHSLRAASRRR
jgi:hypothetical protein